MTAFVAGNDLQPGPNRESNSRDERIPKPNTAQALAAELISFQSMPSAREGTRKTTHGSEWNRCAQKEFDRPTLLETSDLRFNELSAVHLDPSSSVGARVCEGNPLFSNRMPIRRVAVAATLRV